MTLTAEQRAQALATSAILAELIREPNENEWQCGFCGDKYPKAHQDSDQRMDPYTCGPCERGMRLTKGD
jgi:hypothetical protein